ncbi:hypothetical protein A2U01_0112254, partial [Trifolium medium]|nr:hypothetical protein [Trifolium medium]
TESETWSRDFGGDRGDGGDGDRGGGEDDGEET